MMLIIMLAKRAARKRARKRAIAETRAANADAFFLSHASDSRPLRRFV